MPLFDRNFHNPRERWSVLRAAEEREGKSVRARVVKVRLSLCRSTEVFIDFLRTRCRLILSHQAGLLRVISSGLCPYCHSNFSNTVAAIILEKIFLLSNLQPTESSY